MLTQTLHGATLRHIVAVCLIVGIESVAALPHVNNTLKDYRLNGAATTVWEDMHRAQFMAIRESRTIRIEFNPDSYSIIRIATGEVALTRHYARDYPDIRLVVNAGGNGIVFDRTGATAGDSAEIVITGPAGTRRFTILATGVIGNLP